MSLTAAGAAVGGTFGLVRAVTLFAGAGVRRPEQLVALDGWLRRWERPGARLAEGAQALVVVLVLAAALARG